MSLPTARILDLGDDAMLGLCPDGRRLWLRGPCVPGDTVAFAEEGRGGRVLHILEPAADRIPAPCPHFAACPGCALQPLPYARQLDLKVNALVETLKRLGGFAELPVAGVWPSPEPYGTRNKLDFTVECGRLGYTAWDGFLPVAECPVGHPALTALIAPLTAWLTAHPAHRLHRAMLRTGADRTGVHLLLRGELAEPEREALLAWAVDRPELTGLSLQADWKQPWETLAGDGWLRFELAGEAFEVEHDRFFQVHDALADTLVRTAMHWLAEDRPGRLLDLFCGAGAFTRPAARVADTVLGLDGRPGGGPLFRHADLRRGLPPDVLKQPWDTVLTDPPRAGMDKILVKQLRDRVRPRRILYVSCNPATLARDLKRLRADGAYRLDRLHAFDLFPQTPHLEALVLLERV